MRAVIDKDMPAEVVCRCRLCRPQPPVDKPERQCIRDVERHGWHVILVDAGDDPDEPAFAYTVGLPHRVRHPELVVSGLPFDLMHTMLNDVAQRVLSGRRVAKPGTIVEGALAGAALVVEDLTEEVRKETVTWSTWFHRREVPAVQLVWPTTSGVYPWQPGAPQSLIDGQPSFWRVPCPRSGPLATVPEWSMPVPADAMAYACTHVLDEGENVRFAIREAHPTRGEEWSFHCGLDHDGPSNTARCVHLAHVLRAAPTVAQLNDLGLGESAWREDVDTPWVRSADH